MTHITLDSLLQVIREVHSWKTDRVLKIGISRPHSYRGYYDQVAFEVRPKQPMSECLAAVERAFSEEFIGYKGGEYVYTNDTPVWIAEYGSTGVALDTEWLAWLFHPSNYYEEP